MKAVHRQIAYLLLLASVCSAAVSGCTVGGKSFSMDSNSRVPFFGLELRERKAKSGAPSYNSISRSAVDQSRVAAAVGSSSTTSFDLLKKSDKRLAGAKVIGTVEDPAHSAASSAQSAKSPPVQAIPFPRTDNQPGSSDRRTASVSTDFQ